MNMNININIAAIIIIFYFLLSNIYWKFYEQSHNWSDYEKSPNQFQ